MYLWDYGYPIYWLKPIIRPNIYSLGKLGQPTRDYVLLGDLFSATGGNRLEGSLSVCWFGYVVLSSVTANF